MELLQNRLRELAEKAYRNNQYVFTNFLNMAEQNAFLKFSGTFPMCRTGCTAERKDVSG